METISKIRRQVAELSYELATVKYELTFRKMMRALQVKFDPDQPRDEIGRWTGAGNDPSGQTSTDISSARRGQSEAVCWATVLIC